MVAFAVFVVVAGVLYLGLSDGQQGNLPGVLSDTNVLKQALVSELTQKDTDGDGLLDWEENLWGTDPESTDTDGDGTSDGDEVSAERNPTIPGPDDTMEIPSPAQVVESNEDLNATDFFAQQFFREYVTRRQSDVGINALSQQAIISSSLAALPRVTTSVRYDSSDLIISTKSGKEAVFDFGNRLGAIVNTSGKPDSENELGLLTLLLEEKDRSVIEDFKILADSYKNVREQFSHVPVPAGGVAIHIDMLNSMASVENSILGMSRALDDPVTAMVSLNAYETHAGNLLDALTRLRGFFLENDVIYSPDESGYVMQVTE
jgi:hypothetical protein